MERVAKKARLSRALIYVYFQDKNDLLLAIAERALADLRERFIAAAAAQKIRTRQGAGHRPRLRAVPAGMPYRFDACSRFHAHQAAGQPTDEACAAAGDAVIAVIVEALHARGRPTARSARTSATPRRSA